MASSALSLFKPATAHKPVVLDTIRVGDSIKRLGQMPDGFVELTVFSPPYDGIRDYKEGWSLDYQQLGAELFRRGIVKSCG